MNRKLLCADVPRCPNSDNQSAQLPGQARRTRSSFSEPKMKRDEQPEGVNSPNEPQPRNPSFEDQTIDELQLCILRLKDGDQTAEAELVQLTSDRILQMTKRQKGKFFRINRWDQTEDISQDVSIRLLNELSNIKIESLEHYFNIVAGKIRQVLLDRNRKYKRRDGLAGYLTAHVNQNDSAPAPPKYEVGGVTHEPSRLAEWGEFQETLRSLSDRSQQVLDLLFICDLTQNDAAQVMGISVRHVKRLFRDAKLELAQKMGGNLPDLE